MLKKKQKGLPAQAGISLIITFFILAILLAVVFSTSIILYSEIKTIKNIGNSVLAFYAALSGAEKSIYYERKAGGFCGICTDCPTSGGDNALNCQNCSLAGSDCGVSTCTSCSIYYKTIFQDTNKSYEVNITTQLSAPDLLGTINSKGNYRSTLRAIESYMKMSQ